MPDFIFADLSITINEETPRKAYDALCDLLEFADPVTAWTSGGVTDEDGEEIDTAQLMDCA